MRPRSVWELAHIHPLRRNSFDANRNRPSSNPVIFAAHAQCFSACSLEVITNPSILCAPAQCLGAGAPPLSLLHINIHPLRRNSFDAGVTDSLPTPPLLLRRRGVSVLAAWKSLLTRPFCVRPRSVSELVRPPLSLLHINIHPLRRNSLDEGRNRVF